jgi:hypothetical protein
LHPKIAFEPDDVQHVPLWVQLAWPVRFAIRQATLGQPLKVGKV